MSANLLRRGLYKTVTASSAYSSSAEGTVDPLVQRLLHGLYAGRRASLAESITLVETSHPKKKFLARQLLTNILQNAQISEYLRGYRALSFRIGLSGPPGAGKSTFIEAFGKFLTGKGMKVAVLTVDPSSVRTGGSLLGDKTRMPELSRDMSAYIRPSPSRGHLGGVTRSTNEAIVLCEAAGYDIVIVETIGVGQSEFSVVDMVDLFTLVIPPGGGDELQGLKKGIMEMSDLVIVNKSDGDMISAAQRIQYEYISAFKYIPQKTKVWKPPVKRISSVTGDGIPELWDVMKDYQLKMQESGELIKRRRLQRCAWLWTYLKENLITTFVEFPDIKKNLKKVEKEVMNGILSPGDAADMLLQQYLEKIKPS
ncbi:hypothetical protein SK128_020540 [Halocaridina rubra]|uniref:AAA+ ATPase domain-containing protein n=1 Tax=Halocaridina rubra TaxID=373956 RepID=A0AAN8X0T0_HALRR